MPTFLHAPHRLILLSSAFGQILQLDMVHLGRQLSSGLQPGVSLLL